jgi:outer membrane protein assembly factor BamA
LIHSGLAILLFCVLLATARAQASVPPMPPIPTFAEMEAAGAKIGQIRIVTQDIFDATDPLEDKLLFRWANALHFKTRPGVIESALLFQRGDTLSLRVLDETERLLRSNRYLYDVQFRPLAFRDGVVDIEVMTRDTWTLDPGVTLGRAGDANSGGTKLKEYNLLGTGVAVSLGRSINADRTSNEFEIAKHRAFGTWTSLAFSHASNSDGRADAVLVVRPFYALDARWAAGVTAFKDDRIDSLYNAGNVVSQYRRRRTHAEIFGGWSAGRLGG